MKEIRIKPWRYYGEWLANYEAAKGEVVDGDLYLICKNGAFWRPKAAGYTDSIAQAGIYSARLARKYLSLDCISVMSLASAREMLVAEIDDIENRLIGARITLASFDDIAASKPAPDVVSVAEILGSDDASGVITGDAP